MSKLQNTLTSRKLWTLIGAMLMVVVTALQVNPYPITEVIVAVTTLAVGYMTTTAWEDNAERKANAEVQKAAIQNTPTVTDAQVEAKIVDVLEDIAKNA